MAAQAKMRLHKVTANIPSISANTTGELAITITGLVKGVDHYGGHEDDLSNLNAGLGAAGGEVTADDEVTIRWINTTGGALNPGSTTIFIITWRGDDGSGDASLGSGPDWSG